MSEPARLRARFGGEMSAPALAGFSNAWVLFRSVLPRATSLTPIGVGAAARAVRIVPGGLPNGSGVQFGAPAYRAEQIFRWVHGRAVGSVAEMTDLGKALRAKLGEAAEVRSLSITQEQVSRDGTRKLRLKTADERLIETVLIPDGDAGADASDEVASAAKVLRCMGRSSRSALGPRT